MKKTFSVLLALLITMLSIWGAFHLSASALQSDKITPALQEKLDAASDSDTIEVWVDYVPKKIIDYNELDRLTDERVGFVHTDRSLTLEQVNEWTATRNVVENEMIHQYYVDLFDRLGIETEEIIGNWEPDNPVSRKYSKHYILSKAKIMALTDHEEVASVDTYHHQESAPYQPDPTDPTELSPSERYGKYLFAERYFGEDYYSTEYNPDTGYDPDWVFYDELYYHYDKNGEIDWALIRANKTAGETSEACAHFGSYFLFGDFYYGFTLGIGIYHVKGDYFSSVSNDPYWEPEYQFPYENYDGFFEALEALKKLPQNRTCLAFLMAGDMDADGEITILDTTWIQRFLADFPYNECGGHVTFGAFTQSDMADYDCDGDATILDATAIQRHLAELE